MAQLLGQNHPHCSTNQPTPVYLYSRSPFGGGNAEIFTFLRSDLSPSLQPGAKKGAPSLAITEIALGKIGVDSTPPEFRRVIQRVHPIKGGAEADSSGDIVPIDRQSVVCFVNGSVQI